MDTVAVTFFAGIAAMAVAGFGAQFRAMDTASTLGIASLHAAFAAVDAVVFMAAFEGEGVAQSCLQRGFSRTLAIGVSLLSAALGISLGLGFKVGFVNQLVITGILGTTFPLATLMLYPPIERARRIANYRKLEGHLIKP
jgi:hypothetical protein